MKTANFVRFALLCGLIFVARGSAFAQHNSSFAFNMVVSPGTAACLANATAHVTIVSRGAGRDPFSTDKSGGSERVYLDRGWWYRVPESQGPGRGGSYPPPLPQIRTCPNKAYGSSADGLAARP